MQFYIVVVICNLLKSKISIDNLSYVFVHQQLNWFSTTETNSDQREVVRLVLKHIDKIYLEKK